MSLNEQQQLCETFFGIIKFMFPKEEMALNREVPEDFFDTHHLSIYFFDPDGTILYCNKAAEELYGHSSSEAIGSDGVLLLMDPRDNDPSVAIRTSRGEICDDVFRVKNKMGERFFVRAINMPFYNDATFAGVISMSGYPYYYQGPSTRALTCSGHINPGHDPHPSLQVATRMSNLASLSTDKATNHSTLCTMDVETEYADCDFSLQNLVYCGSIGHGASGTVYRGKLDGTDVAIKVLPKQQYADDMVIPFKKEVSIMKKLRHPNVLLFMGVATSPKVLCIVTEFLPRGSLFTLLQTNGSRLSWRRRVQMALDIARGMNYLHCCTPPLIHRDLKSSNLLVDNNFTVKVGDFGLSHLKTDIHLAKPREGTLRWMAQEVLCGAKGDEKSDVYSYGVVLWELVTEKIPWEDCTTNQVMGAVVMNRQLEIPKDLDPQCASIIESCLHSNPLDRPTFKELAQRFTGLLTQLSSSSRDRRSFCSRQTHMG